MQEKVICNTSLLLLILRKNGKVTYIFTVMQSMIISRVNKNVRWTRRLYSIPAFDTRTATASSDRIIWVCYSDKTNDECNFVAQDCRVAISRPYTARLALHLVLKSLSPWKNSVVLNRGCEEAFPGVRVILKVSLSITLATLTLPNVIRFSDGPHYWTSNDF